MCTHNQGVSTIRQDKDELREMIVYHLSNSASRESNATCRCNYTHTVLVLLFIVRKASAYDCYYWLIWEALGHAAMRALFFTIRVVTLPPIPFSVCNISGFYGDQYYDVGALALITRNQFNKRERSERHPSNQLRHKRAHCCAKTIHSNFNRCL